MKKVLFVVPYISDGGAERVVSIWTGELVKFDCEVHLLLFYRVNNEYSVDNKVTLHTLADNADIYKSFNRIEKLMAIRKMIKSIKPDVVLPFVTYVGIIVNIARFGLGVNVLETIRIDPKSSPVTRLGRFIRNLSVFFSKGCVVQTNTQLEYFPKCFQRKMAVLSNPIAPYILNYQKKLYAKEIKKVIAVGRLEEQKNFPMLIEAFSKLVENYSELSLDIYGEGSLKKYMEELIYKLKLQGHIRLCGHTNNIGQALCASDLFVLTSNNEGMPNSLMEAMAAGLPCISTDCPTGPEELIQNGYNGYLIPVGDREALIKAMKEVLDNRDVAISMGHNARETIINNYSASESGKKLFLYINKI